MKPEMLRALVDGVDSLNVPAFDFSAIQARATRLRARSPITARKLLNGSALVVILSSLAAAASHFTPLDVTHRFGTWQIYGPQASVNMRPTQATLDRLARTAPYRLVWPTSLPIGTVLHTVSSVASEVILLDYACPQKGTLRFQIIPYASGEINVELRAWFSSLKMQRGLNREWRAGEERVRVQTNCLSESQIQRIREATIAAGRSVGPARP